MIAYSTDELRDLLTICSTEDRLLFEFFLGSGARDGEVAHACWTDIDFAAGLFTITEKQEFGWTLKDREERVVPLPDTLVAKLLARREIRPTDRLLFPTPSGTPDQHILRRFKMSALRAGLNCGHCVNKQGKSCGTHPVCRRFHLHALRKTFATLHHEAGVSPRTLMPWLGHADLATTLNYLAVAEVRSPKTRN